MKLIHHSVLVTLLLMISGFCSYAQSARQITGKWKTDNESKNFQMEIYLAKDGNYCGVVINDNRQHSKNGTVVLEKLNYNSISNRYQGIMSPPEANISLNVTLTVENNDRLKLVAKKFLMSKTMYLTRIK